MADSGRADSDVVRRDTGDLNVTDQLRIQFYFALYCREHRKEIAPESKVPWPKVFENKWKESLEAYAKRAKRERIAERIIEYELATYGRSRAKTRIEETQAMMRQSRAGKVRKKRREKK